MILPGLGFLRDLYPNPFLVHWKLENNVATSDQLPGVRIPGASFMGVSGLAPSHEKLLEWTKRENDSMAHGGLVFPPDAGGSVPPSGPVPAKDGLRTILPCDAAETSM